MRFGKTSRLAAVGTMALGLAFAQSGNNGGNTPAPAQTQHTKGAWFDRMAQKLGLTDDQKAQAKTIYTNARSESKQYIPQLKTAHEAFQTALNNGASDDALQKAANDQAQVMAKLQVIRAKAMRDFEKILTPDQVAKFKEMRAFMRGRFGRHGFGGFAG